MSCARKDDVRYSPRAQAGARADVGDWAAGPSATKYSTEAVGTQSLTHTSSPGQRSPWRRGSTVTATAQGCVWEPSPSVITVDTRTGRDMAELSGLCWQRDFECNGNGETGAQRTSPDTAGPPVCWAVTGAPGGRAEATPHRCGETTLHTKQGRAGGACRARREAARRMGGAGRRRAEGPE